MFNAKLRRTHLLGFFVSVCLFLAAVFGAGSSGVQAQVLNQTDQKTGLTIYLFSSKYCPHCTKAKEFLKQVETKYPQTQVIQFEVEETAGRNLLTALGKTYNFESGAVPLIIIGDKTILGFGSAQNTGVQIENLIEDWLQNPTDDIVKPLLKYAANNNASEKESPSSAKTTQQVSPSSTTEGVEINIPLVGNINSKTTSLPIFTIGIALLDGFNPCAMWVLLFLISLLIGLNDKKKMWILGSTFILTSGFVYFLFLSAWLNFFLWIGYSNFVRLVIGALAIFCGTKFIKEYFKNKDGGCEIVGGNEKRKNVFNKLKQISQNNNLAIAMLAMVGLAFAVNLVELICSAGLPAVFTQVLALNELSKIQYFAYLVLYIVVFMLDDLFVFFVAMFTLEITGIQSKYARYSHLVGGVLILVIGILLLLRPDLLMFS